MKAWLIGALAALTMAGAAGAAESLRLPPMDEAAADLSWQRFKARLTEALARRDRKAVMDVIDPAVRNVSGRVGIAEFGRTWQPQSADSAVWTALPRLLQLGGVYVKQRSGQTEVCAPYVRFRWPDDRPFDGYVAVVAREALLKASPSNGATTLLILNHQVAVPIDWEVHDESASSPQKWVKVQIGNLTGYLPDEQVFSPLEHHACFRKFGEAWRLVSFGVGP